MQAKTTQQFIAQAEEGLVSYHLLLLALLKVPLSVEQSPQFFKLIELVSRVVGILETVKHVPYDLKFYKLRLPADLCDKYHLNARNLWNRNDGVPKDELKDAVLECFNKIGRRCPQVSYRGAKAPKLFAARRQQGTAYGRGG